MKNIVTIIYPDDFSAAFVVETDGIVDPIVLLEKTFAEWNHGSGSESERFLESKKRSLSVNDIVCVNGSYFQCASIGWEPVTAEYVNLLENDIATHPTRLNASSNAWSILQDVMWNRAKKNVFCMNQLD